MLDKYWENQEVKYDYNEEIKVRTGNHKKKFIVDIDEEDADIVVERPASIEDPKVLTYISVNCSSFNFKGTKLLQVSQLFVIRYTLLPYVN